MQLFKEDIIGDLGKIQKDITQSKYKVFINYAKQNEEIKITIKNNVPILPAEQERINKRYNNAQKYDDFSEAYEDMYDDTEGAGLGIILTIMLLKNAGIPANNFKISSDGTNTYTSFMIPKDLRPAEMVTQVKKQILNEVDILPTFPQNILDLQAMCENKDILIDDLTLKIQPDSSLTADILKLANSAGFMGAQKIETIHDALMRIGLQNLKHVLVAASSKKILDKRYSKFEAIWKHNFKVAFYARQIARITKNSKLIELAFVGGLLHDIGKIILLAVDLKLTNWISDFVKHRQIRTTTLLEEVSIGISHSKIGFLLAEKWNFGDFLKEAIECHHAPLNCQDEFKDVVYAVYLANQFSGIEERKYDYFFIDKHVQNNFKLSNETECRNLHEKLKNLYKNHQSII
jgi:putative nucleotidyltransferase with HDIG domain